MTKEKFIIKKVNLNELKKGDNVLIKLAVVENRNEIIDLEFSTGEKTKIFSPRPGICKIQIFPEIASKNNIQLLQQSNE